LRAGPNDGLAEARMALNLRARALGAGLATEDVPAFFLAARQSVQSCVDAGSALITEIGPAAAGSTLRGSPSDTRAAI